MIGHDGYKRITGTKLHVAVEKNGYPISMVMSTANEHDSSMFIDVMEGTSDFLTKKMIREIKNAHADLAYDSMALRTYLKDRKMSPRIPFRKKKNSPKRRSSKKRDSVRYVVERFFSWLKNGFHKLGMNKNLTTILDLCIWRQL